MLQFSFSKIIFILAVVLGAVFFALPNALPGSITSKFPHWWQPVALGLDLRGGSYLLLEVDTSAVFKEQLTDVEEQARGALRDAKIRYRNIRTAEGSVFVTTEPGDRAAARTAIAKLLNNMEFDTPGDDRIRITVSDRI